MPARLLLSSRRRALTVTVVGFLLGLLVVLVVGQGQRSPSPTDDLPQGYASTEAVELQEQLPDEGQSSAIALFTTEDEIGQFLPDLESIVADQDSQAPVIPAEDGTAAIAPLAIDSETATETEAAVSQLREDLDQTVPDGVSAQVTGPAAIEADLASVFQGADTRLLAVTAAVVALLLLVTYRSPILWVLPLAVVGLADRMAVALATQLLEVVGIPWNESTVGILSVLVFGAGTNYALLLVSRYRDELRGTDDRLAAMQVSVKRTAEAVFASASTVFLGLVTLLLSVVPTTRALGLACAVGVLVAAVFVLVVLPALLVLPGRWIFWPKVPKEGQTPLVDGRSAWRRIGESVQRRPMAVIAGTLIVLIGLGVGTSQVRLGLPPAEQFLDEPEAISASQRLAESFPAGNADPTLVLIESEAEDVTTEISETVSGVDGISSVETSAQGNGVTELQVIVDAQAGTPESLEIVREVKASVADRDQTYVGGAEAQTLDARDGATSDRWLIMPLILGLVLVALIGILRSLLAPLLLVTSVVVSFAAALGAGWWIFTQVLGFSALDEGVPLLSFLFLVALGVDYNIFLITRTVEEAPRAGTRLAVVRSLAATGGVITSAGILLAAVFAVLGVLPLVVLAQIGTIVCVGVLLDTLVVRTLLVPAIVSALGESFWWPRRIQAARHSA